MKTDSSQKNEQSENVENLKANSEKPEVVLSATLGNLVNFLIKEGHVNETVIFDLQGDGKPDSQKHSLSVTFSVRPANPPSVKAEKNDAGDQPATGVEADHSAETKEKKLETILTDQDREKIKAQSSST